MDLRNPERRKGGPRHGLDSVQVDKEQKRSYEAHEELDAANARAIRLRDRLEDLEETVHHYWTWAHVAEELIQKYPEDEGLYEVDLPSLSSLQNKLTASEVMPRRMATFAHWLHSADPANLLHHHNIADENCCRTGSKLTHPRRATPPVDSPMASYTSSRLVACCITIPMLLIVLMGCIQDMFAHSRFSSDEAFLAAAQHAGYVDARPGSLEPLLHHRLFSFDHPIPLPQSPTSNHIPAVPMMDTVMLMWEDMIGAYVREVLGYPASPGRILPPVEVPSFNNPLPPTTSLVADDACPMLGVSDPVSRSTPLFLLGSLSPTSPHSPSPIPSSPRAPDCKTWVKIGLRVGFDIWRFML
ncbi:hypothetical protein GG344DRAFT_84727 [Lentinula edodes]|nr:hypothetical protein GG344DRAFT_84727 [Lentinula edodes]